MKHSEARTLVHNIQVLAQKSRSNLREFAMGHKDHDDDPMMLVIEDLNPHLFESSGRVQILEFTMKLMEKETIEPIELYNLLNLVNREPTLPVMAILADVDLPSAHPIPSWITGFEPENDWHAESAGE